MNVVEIKDFLFNALMELQAKEGRRISVTEFATYLDASQQQTSAWMAGKYKPSADNIAKIAKRFPDIYDALNMPRPASNLDQLPPGLRALFDSVVSDISSALSKRGIPPEDPEADKIAMQILQQHGFSISIENSEKD